MTTRSVPPNAPEVEEALEDVSGRVVALARQHMDEGEAGAVLTLRFRSILLCNRFTFIID